MLSFFFLKNKKGSSMVIVLGFVIMFTILVAAMFKSRQSEMTQLKNIYYERKAYYLAKAAIEHTILKIKKTPFKFQKAILEMENKMAPLNIDSVALSPSLAQYYNFYKSNMNDLSYSDLPDTATLTRRGRFEIISIEAQMISNNSGNTVAAKNKYESYIIKITSRGYIENTKATGSDKKLAVVRLTNLLNINLRRRKELNETP